MRDNYAADSESSRGLLLIGCFLFVLPACAIWENERSIDGLRSPPNAALNEEYGDFKQPSDSGTTLVIQTLFAEFLDAKVKAQKNKSDRGTLSTYADAGIALSNRACANWFSIHNANRERTDYQQGLINLIGNVINTGLSFSDSNVNLMGYTSLVLGGVNTGYELFKEDHFLSGTIWKLEKGVRDGRVTAADNLKSNLTGDDPYTYFELQDALLDYHDTCSRLRLIGYIEESIELARYQPESTEFSIESTELHDANKDLFQIARGSRGLFSEKRLRELYVVFRASETSWATELKEDSYITDIFTTIEQLRTREGEETDDDVARDSETARRFMDLLDRVGVILNMEETIRRRLEEKEQAEAREQQAREEAREQAGSTIQNVDGTPNETLIDQGDFDQPQSDAINEWLEAYRMLQEAQEIPTEASAPERLPIMLETVPRTQPRNNLL